MGKPDGNNIMAIGAAIMGLSLAAIFVCACMFCGSIYYDTGIWLALVVILLMLAFMVGFIVLFVGIVIKAIQSEKKKDVITKPVNMPAKETTPTVNEDKKPIDTSGMIKCPYCGKEQKKNSFGCIFCHEKF